MLDKWMQDALTTPAATLALALCTGCFSPSTESTTNGDESETEGGPESGGPGAGDRGMGGSDDSGGDGTGNDGSNGDGKSVAGLDADCGPGLFGDVLVGQAKVAEIVLTNEGQVPTAPIETSLASPESFEIASDQCEGVSLDPGETCTVRVRYEPVEVGEQVSNTVRFDAGDAAASCSLNADGVVGVNVERTCGVGTISSEPQGLECGSRCSSVFRTSDILLSRISEPGVMFFGWTGACKGLEDCELTVDRGEVDVGAQVLGMTQPTVVSSEPRPLSSSIAFDPAGGLHLALIQQLVVGGVIEGVQLSYLYRNPAGQWGQEVLLDGEDGAGGPRLRLDGSGTLHLVYSRGGTEIAYLRRPRNQGWDSPTAVDTVVDTGRLTRPSLALDSNDGVHIVYVEYELDDNEADAFQIKYVSRAHQQDFNPVQYLPLTGNVDYPSIAVDSDERLHLAYANRDDTTVNYVVRTPAGALGQSEVVAPNGRRPSLTSDTSGQLHIVYSGADSDEVRYVGRDMDGAWTSPEIVDNIGSVGNNATAVDENGWVHFIYHTQGTSDLRYAIRDGLGQWGAPLPIATAGFVGAGASLAVGSEGRVDVVYMDQSDHYAIHVSLRCP